MISDGYVLPRMICPGNDLDQMVDRQEAAKQMFMELCPAGARLADIHGVGIRENEKYKCAWEVYYVRVNGYEHIGPEELARQIISFRPNNTSINAVIMVSSSLKVVYSVGCACRDSVDEINIVLDKLKMEENK